MTEQKPQEVPSGLLPSNDNLHEDIRKIVAEVKMRNEEYEQHGQELKQFKKDKIIEAGKRCEIDPEFKDNKHLICTFLKREFDGTIAEDYVGQVCPSKWKDTKKGPAPSEFSRKEQPPRFTCLQAIEAEAQIVKDQYPYLQNRQIREIIKDSDAIKKFGEPTVRKEIAKILPIDDEPHIYMTNKELQKQEHDDTATVAKELKQQPQHVINARQAIAESSTLNSMMYQLLDKLTGMTSHERANILAHLEKGKMYRAEIADKSKEHLLKIAKGTPNGYLEQTLGMIQSLHFLIRKFEEVLSDEVIARKKNASMVGE